MTTTYDHEPHHATAPAVTPEAARVRPDLYAPIHKALRALMFDTLARIGRIDLDDAAERDATLEQAELLLEQLESHLHHENEFVHAAIEARRPGAAQVTADAHVEHADTIGTLRGEIAALRVAPAPEQMRLATRLYRHLALFVAENLEHMHYEETANNAALWALYSDEELHAIHDRLVAHLDARILSTVAVDGGGDDAGRDARHVRGHAAQDAARALPGRVAERARPARAGTLRAADGGARDEGLSDGPGDVPGMSMLH